MNIPMQDIYFVVGMINTAYSDAQLNLKLQAQNTLNYLRQAYLSQFFAMLGDIIQDTIWSNETRKSTCVLASQSVVFKDNEGKCLWDKLNFAEQENFKQKILAFFASPTAEPVDGVALVIGAIASIELSRNQWKDIVNALINNCYSEAHPQASYEMLTEILKSSSAYLTEYQDHFIKLTEAQLKLKNELSVMNLNMWKELAEDFSEKFMENKTAYDTSVKSNFLQSVGQKLLHCMIDCLFVDQHFDSQFKDIKINAFKSIQSMVKVCNESVIQQIMNAFQNTFNSASLSAKEDGILLFATIGLFPDKKLLNELLKKNFSELLNLLNEEDNIALEKSMIGLFLLAESSPEVFLTQNNIELLIAKLLQFVKTTPYLKMMSLKILNSLASGLRKESIQNQNKDTSQLFKGCIEYYEENINSAIQEGFDLAQIMTLMVISYCMATNSVDELKRIIKFVIDKSTYFINKGNQYQLFVQQFESVFSTALLAVRHQSSNQIIEATVHYINFRISKNLSFESTLQLIGASANSFSQEFQQSATSYWNIIKSALNSGELKTIQAALICLGDLMRNDYQFYCTQTEIIKFLFNSFHNVQNWQIKTDILQSLTDFTLIRKSLEFYIEDFLEMFSRVYVFIDDMIKNNKKWQHLDRLKESFISCCTAFVLNQEKTRQDLLQQFERVANFVFLTCSKSQNPTVEYLNSCLYLMFDMMGSYEKQLMENGLGQKVMQSAGLQEMIQSLNKFADRTNVQDLIGYINMRKSVFNK